MLFTQSTHSSDANEVFSAVLSPRQAPKPKKKSCIIL